MCLCSCVWIRGRYISDACLSVTQTGIYIGEGTLGEALKQISGGMDVFDGIGYLQKGENTVPGKEGTHILCELPGNVHLHRVCDLYVHAVLG